MPSMFYLFIGKFSDWGWDNGLQSVVATAMQFGLTGDPLSGYPSLQY